MASIRKADSGDIIATMRDVTVTFDGYVTRALSRVDLDVWRGEVFGIVGAKGAGKSTLLRILTGRLRPTEGKVKVFGRSPRWGAVKARIGYVPGKADAERLPGLFSRLFGGKQEAQASVGLAQAIMGDRELVVLDEPFAEVGPAEKTELKKLARELAGRGKTVILTSETLVDTKDVADRLLILDGGRILAVGSLQELLKAPRAIRFLASVVPPEVDQQIAKILQREISAKAAPAQAASKAAEVPVEQKSVEAPTVDEHLAKLTQGTESSAPSEQKPKEENPIDHGKLEGLTKPGKPE